LNLRGVREPVAALASILGVFLVTHALVVLIVLLTNAARSGEIARETGDAFRGDLADPKIGFVALLLVFVRAYSLGGGTYTGLESVANATNIMRAPVVRTAKRTMLYMSVSLAVLASGMLVCYLLTGVEPQAGKTLNAVLVDRAVGSVSPFGL